MATLNPQRIKEQRKRKRNTFLLITGIELILSPLLIYMIHQCLLRIGSGSLNFTNMNYSYTSAIKLLLESDQVRTLWIFLEIAYAALYIFASMTVEPVIARVDTKKITDGIEVPVPAGNGQHGNERFLTEEEKDELYDSFLFTGKEKLNGKGGVVVHFQKLERGKELIYYIGQDLHSLLIGASGAGKTRRVLLETLWLQIMSNLSVIISDVKGEIYFYTRNYAEEKGYTALAVDFRNPKKSAHYNFLQPILDALEEKDTAKAVDYTWDLVSVLVGQQKGEPLWYNGETATLAAAILIIAMDAPKEFRNMTNVYYFIAFMCKAGELGEMPINSYLQKLEDTHPAKGVFAMAEIAPNKTRSSFFTSALGTLRLFTNPNVAAMTEKSDFKLEDISKKKTILYLIIPDEKKTMYPLLSILVTQLYASQVEVANQNGLCLPVKTDYDLDEVGNFPYIPVLGNMISAGRSRGVRCNLVIQDYQQLESKYKEEFKNIKTNCQVKLFLKSDDDGTLKSISETLGKYTVEVSSASTSVSEGKKNNANFSSSASLTGRALLEVSEIAKIKPPHALCMIQGERAGINYLPDLSEYRLNQLYGLGDEEFNKQLVMQRDKERPEQEISDLKLWGIWKKYQAIQPQMQEEAGGRVSFLNL